MSKISSFTKFFSLISIITLLTTLALPNIISTLAQNKINIDEYKIINEQILSLQNDYELKKFKQNININNLATNLNTSQEFKGGREKLNEHIDNIKNLSAIEVLAVNEISIDSATTLTQKQKNIAKQIQKLITTYIQKKFGNQFSIYTLADDQKNQLEDFIIKDKKIQELNAINNGNESSSNGNINTHAASWESCEWETSFPDWVGYEYKTFYGTKANWVGRLANTEDERSGIMPCDYSFYLNGYRANKVDGWSIATECAVKWSNGISAKRYGYSNQKMIIGHGRLTACGVWSFNTEMLRDQIRFYN